MQNESLDMTQGSLATHLVRLGVPTTIGLFFNTFYNLVDTFWVGKLSTDALAGLSLNFPVYMLVMSMGIGFSAASGALIANALGAKKVRKSRKYLSQSITISLLSSIGGSLLLMLFLGPIFKLLNASGNVFTSAMSYGRINSILKPFISTM